MGILPRWFFKDQARAGCPCYEVMSEEILPTKCPICKRLVPVPKPGATKEERGFYPFCSDRCRMVDLGRWLSDAYQIPVREEDDDEEKSGV